MNRTARTLAALATVATLAAPGPWHSPPVVEHVRTGGAWLCQGALVVRYGIEKRTGREWTFVQDDGRVTVQTSPAPGRWVTLPATSGGEGVRRVAGTTVPPLQLVRIVRSGIASTAKPTTDGCPT